MNESGGENKVELAVIDKDGNSAGKFEIGEACLEREKGNQAVQDVVVGFLAGRRSGTASTKNRAAVRGSEAKPWRQKGTGRARAGNVRSPIWRGGGVVFGPTPRDYSKKTNSKVRKLALRRAFTSRLDEGDILAISGFNLQEPKTKLMVSILKKIGAGENALIICSGGDDSAMLSAKNLPSVTAILATTVKCISNSFA